MGPDLDCDFSVAYLKQITSKFVEDRLGVLQVGGVEALGEPVVDFREHRVDVIGMRLVSS